MLIDINRITNVVGTPLLVDVDTGFGASAFNIARTVKSLIKAGAAALHIEDQVGAKRCGHRPGKEVVSKEEMVDRIKAAVDARTDEYFVIGARTDAFANEGFEKTLERAIAYAAAGSDFIFAEAVPDLTYYQKFVDATGIPVLANITEFGMIPMYTVDELRRTPVWDWYCTRFLLFVRPIKQQKMYISIFAQMAHKKMFWIQCRQGRIIQKH